MEICNSYQLNPLDSIDKNTHFTNEMQIKCILTSYTDNPKKANFLIFCLRTVQARVPHDFVGIKQLPFGK